MPYSYNYDVKDVLIGLKHGKKESSDGTVVTGSYYVLLPDGRIQTVMYKADKNGNCINTIVKYFNFNFNFKTIDY